MSSHVLRRLSFAILLIALLTPIAGQAAVINVMEFHQLSFFPDNEGEPVFSSDMAEMFLAMDAGPETEYLNLHAIIPGLSTEPYWVVRNLLLHDDTVGAPYEEYFVRFPMDVLGVEVGVPVTDIMFGFSLDPVPLLDDEYEDWALLHPLDQFGPVLYSEVDVGRVGVKLDLDHPDITTTPPDSTWPTFTDLSDSTIAGILGCLVNNVELDSSQTKTDYNGCVPAACANSLDWMRTFDQNINFPGTLRETYEQLSQLMNRNSPEGVTDEDMMQAKMDFIEAHNLPIEVKYQTRFPATPNVASTSGHSTATDHGAANAWPTAAWLRNEVKNNEDVEIGVSYWYASAGTLACDGGHCMVVTGAGRSASGDWLFFKDDLDQDTNGGLRQVPTAMVPGQFGAIYLPGEGYKKIIPGTPPDTVQVNCRLDSVISESYKAGEGTPPSSETSDGYCQIIGRTIPPQGNLEVEYPNDEERCYNSTVYVLDRTKTPAEMVVDRQWNMNKGKTRVWHNDKPYPVTVYVHNDDKSSGSYDLEFNVVPEPTSEPTFGNPEDYAGFSLGGSDFDDAEFNPAPMPPLVAPGPIMPGFSLFEIPNRLTEFGGTSQLHLEREIHPNPYWENMGLVVDVLTVNAPGDILVDCMATGHVEAMTITGPGRYEMTLGNAMGAPRFEIMLTALNGLDIILDSLGIPSLVPADYTAVEDLPAADRLALSAAPNPFNPSVTFTYRLPTAGDAELTIFDMRGRRVATLVDGPVGDDERTATWHGRDDSGREVPAGTYIGRLTAAGLTREERVTLVK